MIHMRALCKIHDTCACIMHMYDTCACIISRYTGALVHRYIKVIMAHSCKNKIKLVCTSIDVSLRQNEFGCLTMKKMSDYKWLSTKNCNGFHCHKQVDKRTVVRKPLLAFFTMFCYSGKCPQCVLHETFHWCTSYIICITELYFFFTSTTTVPAPYLMSQMKIGFLPSCPFWRTYPNFVRPQNLNIYFILFGKF